MPSHACSQSNARLNKRCTTCSYRNACLLLLPALAFLHPPHGQASHAQCVSVCSEAHTWVMCRCPFALVAIRKPHTFDSPSLACLVRAVLCLISFFLPHTRTNTHKERWMGRWSKAWPRSCSRPKSTTGRTGRPMGSSSIMPTGTKS